jgi:hypothetical protein
MFNKNEAGLNDLLSSSAYEKIQVNINEIFSVYVYEI